MPPLVNGIPPDVGPGDLIRAQDYNAMLAWLRDLDGRVAALEGADESVVITGVIPAGPIRIGDTIEIIGRNFGFSLGAHRVYFNSTRATIFNTQDSGDTRLVLVVPSVPGVSEAGTQVVLTAGNQTSVDTEEVTLRPAVQQQEGSIGLLYTGATVDGADATEIPEDSTALFNFNLESDALLPTTVTLTPDVSEAAWEDSLEVFDSSGNLLTSRQIPLEPGQQTTFSVQLTVPDGTEGTTFTLSVDAQAPGLPTAGGSQVFTVGAELTPSDPAVLAFRVNQVRPAAAQSGSNLQVEGGQTVNVQLQAEFAGPDSGGQHVYTFSVAAPTAPWQRAVPSVFPPFSGPVQFTVTGPGAQLVSFDVTRPAGASASPTTLVCRLERTEDGDTLESTMQFNLQPI